MAIGGSRQKGLCGVETKADALAPYHSLSTPSLLAGWAPGLFTIGRGSASVPARTLISLPAGNLTSLPACPRCPAASPTRQAVTVALGKAKHRVPVRRGSCAIQVLQGRA